MKKNHIILLSVVLVIVAIVVGVFIGKGLSEREPETELPSTTLEETADVVDTTIEQTETQSETETETESETETEASSEEIKSGETIETEYFCITVPDLWQYKYAYTVTEKNENNGYSLTVRHKDSYGLGYGGNLFTISLYSVAQGEGQNLIENAPVPVEYLGVLKVPGVGDFDVIATFPSDAQFNENTMKGYYELFDSKDSVLKTIAPQNGATFQMA